jgi:beta-RFAP synthase
MDFPQWGILVAVLYSRKATSGRPEIELFRSLVPIAVREAEAACRIVLLGILPAIAHADFDAFGLAMEAYRRFGMKKRQIDLESPNFLQVMALMETTGGREE